MTASPHTTPPHHLSAQPLAGRRALVTGANGGIGRALAFGLAAAGADVVLHHHAGAAGAADLADRIAAMGRDATVLEGDFTRPGTATAVARAALEGGPVDILVSNAAIERRGPWGALDPDDLASCMSVNLGALLALSAVLVPPMQARGWGRVVALGSVLASRPRAETIAYAALKSAQATAIRALARDVAGQGVTCNLIAPGAIETEVNAARYADPAFRARVVVKIPAGRQGQPEDCVAPLLMLCSDGAGYITGVEIPVDGGWTCGDAPGALPGVEELTGGPIMAGSSEDNAQGSASAVSSAAASAARGRA